MGIKIYNFIVSGGNGHGVSAERLQENADVLKCIKDEEISTFSTQNICVYFNMVYFILPSFSSFFKGMPWPVFRFISKTM